MSEDAAEPTPLAIVRYDGLHPYVNCLTCGFITGLLSSEAEAARIAYDHNRGKHPTPTGQ